MIKEYNKKNGTDYQVKYAWAEMDIPEGMSTDEWCALHGVTRCNSIKELCAKCDCIFVLAPSNPEKHLEYAKEVFECGKSPYIDKTFAPDYKTAKEIYVLAEKYGVKFFSSSALRYAEELNAYMGNAKAISTLGGGSNLDEYIIHQIEMAVKCLGTGAEKVRYSKHADQEWAEVAYADGRYATMMFARCMPFAATVSGENGKSAYLPINSAFFDQLIADILHFFETGEISFSGCETLEVMKIREAVIKAKATPGEWVVL
jgi:hypothetical protein